MASYKGAVTSVSNLIQSMIDSPKVYAVIRLTIGLSSYGVKYLLLYYCQTNSYQLIEGNIISINARETWSRTFINQCFFNELD